MCINVGVIIVLKMETIPYGLVTILHFTLVIRNIKQFKEFSKAAQFNLKQHIYTFTLRIEPIMINRYVGWVMGIKAD